MSSNIFGRFFLCTFTLLFPFLIFITLFRFANDNNTIFGFYDFFNGLEYTNSIDLKQDLEALKNVFNEFAKLNSVLIRQNEQADRLVDLFGGNSAPSGWNAILKVVSWIAVFLSDSSKSIEYIILSITNTFRIIILVIEFVTDFIPFFVNCLQFFINSLTQGTLNLFGVFETFGSSDMSSHLDWYEGLTSSNS